MRIVRLSMQASVGTALVTLASLVTVIGLAVLGTPAIVAAQDDNDVIDDEAAFGTAPAVAAPVTGDAVVAPAKKSYLKWAYDSLGVGYSIVFLALSFTLVALFVMNLLTARRENVLPSELIEGFEAHLNANQYQQAYEMAKNDESFLGQVLSAGLAKLSTGYSQAIKRCRRLAKRRI